MADHDRRRGEDQQAADLIADLALYPGGGDGSSSSNQSSPSNNDHSLSPRSTAQDGSFFFDSATAFSLFSPSAGQIGPGADLPWSTSVAFSTPLTPAVVHVASPVAGFAATPNRAAGFGGNAAMSRDFWEASPGIPSPMGMGEVAQQPQQMIGMDASSSPTHSAEISFGSLVAEDQCGPSLAPSPQVSSSGSSSFSPPLSTSTSAASSAFSFFNPAGFGNPLSRFYASFGSSSNGATSADPRVTTGQMPAATSMTMDAFSTGASDLNMDSWYAANPLPMSPTVAAPSSAPSRESSSGPALTDANVNGHRPAVPPPGAPPTRTKSQDEAPTRAPSDLELAIPSVAYPSRASPASWGEARLLILGIAKDGAKSRVETQVKISLVLVRPKPGAVASGAADDRVGSLVDAAVMQDGRLNKGGPAVDSFERIGSWPNLKLPAHAAIKRKARKLIRTGVPPEESLFLEAKVTRATEPHEEVFCCASCQGREHKRTQRKREARVRPAQEVSSDEDDNKDQDDDKRKIVVFNSGEWLDFGTGEVTIPARITCYCRHVKEKKGFRISITLRDNAERIVASATSPAIMITDDHKAAASKTSRPASDAEAPKAVKGPENRPPTSGPSRNGSGSVRRSSGHLSDSTDAKRQRRAAAPYDPAQRNARPRSGHLSRSPSFAMTPLMTPLTTSKPGSPTQSRIGPFPRTAPASLAPSPNTNELPLPPVSASQINGDAALGQISAIEAALRAAQRPLQTNGDVQMQDGSPSSLESSPNASGQSGTGLDLHPFPPRHHHSVESFSSNGPSSATSLDLHNQVNGTSGPSSFSPQQQQPPWLSGYSPAMSDPFASRQSSAEAMPPPAHPPTVPSPGWGTETPRNLADAGAQPPRIERLIPCEGPMQGGIEITILGKGFFNGITVVFGDTPAVPTHMWSGSTLVCKLPPSASPGPCVVSFRGVPVNVQSGSDVQVFTYVDNSDQKLMELALQVVGLQMTGHIQDARNVAMRIVGENGNSGSARGSPSSSSGSSGPGTSSLSSLAATLATAADSIMSSPSKSGPGSRTNSSGNLAAMKHEAVDNMDRSFESIIIRFLTLIDFHDPDIKDRDVAQPISHANAQGHTLLHLAVMLGFHKLVSYLIRHNIDVDARDRNGFTALHFAALTGRVTITRLLLVAGAGTYHRNCAARTALDLARDRGQVDVVDLFLTFASPAAGERRVRSRGHSEASSLASSRRSSFALFPEPDPTGTGTDEPTSSDDADSDEPWDPSDNEGVRNDGSDIERRLSRNGSVASLATGFFNVCDSKEDETHIPDAVPVSTDEDELTPSPHPVRRLSGNGWLPRKLRKSLPAPKASSALSKLRLTPSISGITYIPAYTMYGLSVFNPKTWRWTNEQSQSATELQEKRAGAWRAMYGQGTQHVAPPPTGPPPTRAVGGGRSSGKPPRAQIQAKLARRLGYTPETIDESVVNAFAYHESKIRSLKKDKTLWLFWLPILLVALTYVAFETYKYLAPQVSAILPSAFAAQRGWTRAY